MARISRNYCWRRHFGIAWYRNRIKHTYSKAYGLNTHYEFAFFCHIYNTPWFSRIYVHPASLLDWYQGNRITVSGIKNSMLSVKSVITITHNKMRSTPHCWWLTRKAVDQIIQMPLVWNPMTIMWHPCNVLESYPCHMSWYLCIY